jgi:subtilisin family serine protease/tetratricopeptide (TPR) repeat protein
MSRQWLFARIMMTAVCLSVIVETSLSQENLKSVGRYQYAQFDGVWYTVVDGGQGDLVDTKHLIVRLKDRSDIRTFDFGAVGLPKLRDVRGRFADGFYQIQLPMNVDAFEVARRLVTTGKFDELHFNVFVKVNATPNDQHYTNQWNLSRIVMSNGWDITTGSSNVVVAVIDVGADYNHEDLQANRWDRIGYDFYNNDSDPYPNDGARHGTAVAGILGAVTNNTIGVAGVAGGWGGTGGIRIMHLDAGWRDANGDEWIDFAASAQAIDSASAWGARVINMSFGSLDSYSGWESAINRAVNNYGVICIASAGNYRSGQTTAVRYPAAYSDVIAVGATVQNDNRKELNDGSGENWWGSCYGSQLDVMAPGIFVWTTDITGSAGYSTGNYFDRFNGTSAAAPHVAGLAALIRSVNPSLTWQQVRETIRLSADKVPGMGGQNFTNDYGYGRINANKAVRNLYVPQVYSTIATALSNATNGQTVVVASGSHTISDNTTVPPGVTLQIDAGATLDFSGNYKLRIEGTLVANGTSSQPITFTRSGGQWYGIEFYNGQSGSSLQYVTIENAQYGVYNYATNVPISNSLLRNNSTALYSTNNASTINWTRVQYNGYGIQLASYGDANIQPNNVIRYNGWGVYGDGTSVPNLGSLTGYNSLYSQDYYDVYSTYGGTIFARGNWWGSYPALPSVTANVDYSSELSSDPNGWAGKLAAPVKGPVLPGPLSKKGEPTGNDPGMQELAEAYRLYLDGQDERALTVFSNLAEKYPDAFSGARAFVFADRILQRLGREVKPSLTSVIARRPASRIASVAKSLLIGHLLKEGDTDGALTNALALVDHSEKHIAKHALYDVGNIYWYRMQDKSAATNYFRKLIAQYPNDPLTHSALVTMGETSPEPPKEARTTTAMNEAGRLEMSNYPNPFNPQTVIRFVLPVDGQVSLKVVDLLGREVATLVSGFRRAGSHQVEFEAGGLASGMYLSRLEAAGSVVAQKLLLVR